MEHSMGRASEQPHRMYFIIGDSFGARLRAALSDVYVAGDSFGSRFIAASPDVYVAGDSFDHI